MFRKQVFLCTLFAGFVSRKRSLRRTQQGSFSSKKRNFFVLLANMFVKIMANNEQCIAARLPCFCEQYFVWQKNGIVPYSSCL